MVCNINLPSKEIPLDYRLKNLMETDSSKVRWINNCEMVLSTINPKNNIDKKNILIKILETTDTSYTYEYSYLGEAKKVKASAFKIGN